MASLSLRQTLWLCVAIGLWLVLPWWLPGTESLRAALTILLVVAVLWLSEAIHVTLTALLVPVLCAWHGLLPLPLALAHFANPVIFLFLGGFALAAALQAQELDRYLADGMLRLAAGQLRYAVWLLFAVSALLSMWISNTATVAIMLPLVLGLLAQAGDVDARTTSFVLLGVAYSASIGGIATLVGSPPNALAAAYSGVQFVGWLRFGLPVVLLLWPLMLLVLTLLLRPQLVVQLAPPVVGGWHWSRARLMTLLIFALTVAAWIGSAPLGKALHIADMDTWIALGALVLLGLSGNVSWRQIEQQTEWGVLLLFGGGLCLSAMLQRSGASAFLAAELLTLFAGWPHWATLLALTSFVVFLTELTSNTATTALMLPLFVPLAPALGLPPTAMAVLVALAASCAFMLPVATPPNALVYATGRVPQRDMLRAGLLLNLLCSLLLAGLLPWLAG